MKRNRLLGLTVGVGLAFIADSGGIAEAGKDEKWPGAFSMETLGPAIRQMLSDVVSVGACNLVGRWRQGSDMKLKPMPSDEIPGPLRLTHRLLSEFSVLVDREFEPDYVWHMDPDRLLETGEFVNLPTEKPHDAARLLTFKVLTLDPPASNGQWRIMKQYIGNEPGTAYGPSDVLQIMDFNGRTWGKTYYVRPVGSSAPRELLGQFRCIPLVW